MNARFSEKHRPLDFLRLGGRDFLEFWHEVPEKPNQVLRTAQGAFKPFSKGRQNILPPEVQSRPISERFAATRQRSLPLKVGRRWWAH